MDLGIKATITSYAASPNKSYVLLEAPELGKMEEGTDGNVAWELAAMTGPRAGNYVITSLTRFRTLIWKNAISTTFNQGESHDENG